MARSQSPAVAVAERLCRPQRVGVFGHRGVGKTTLLTLLYREAVGGRLPDLRLAAADARTADYLSDKIIPLENGQSIPGTLAETDLRFHLYHKGTRLDLLFIHVSFVGSDSLAQALTSAPETYVDVTDATGQTKKTYADGVMVTQVVPYYQSQAPGITAYRTDIGKYDSGTYTFTSLEGYIAARLFVEALRRNGRVLDDASLTNTLNTDLVDVDVGIGTLLGFSATSHQASHTVWGSRIGGDGKFTVPFTWDPKGGIVPGSS